MGYRQKPKSNHIQRSMGDTRSVLWFRRGQDVKRPFIGVIILEYWVEIPTYVRNDNSTIMYQVETMKSISNEKG